MTAWREHQFFGFILCVVAFKMGTWIYQKWKTPFANPLFLAIVLIIGFLLLTDTSVEQFQVGASYVNLLLTPATAILALSIYRQRKILQQYFLPIVFGCLAGAITSIVSVLCLCKAFRFDEKMTASLFPKSVTTPIAIKVSESLGGIGAITVGAVLVTGVAGAMLAPTLIKLFRVQNRVAIGVAIGTCSHAMGTTKAVELGEIEGAMSSVAIGITGIMTVLLSTFFMK